MTTEQYLIISIVVSVVLAVIGIAVGILIFLKTKKNGGGQGADTEKLAEDVKKDMATTIKIENSMLTGAVNAQASATKDMTGRIDLFMQDVTRKLDDLKTENTKNLLAIKEEAMPFRRRSTTEHLHNAHAG